MSTTTAAYQAVQRDLTQQFNMRIDAQRQAPFYPTLCTLINSTSIDEKYGWLGGLPGIKEWIGDRQFKQLRAANYVLTNKHWESSLQFEKNDVDDDRMGGFMAQIQALADEATFHPDELLCQVIIAAETTACFDGQYFFDTDHSWGDSGTQSNSVTYAAATGTSPTVEEFRGAYHQALKKMLSYKNDQGKFYIRPRIGKLGSLVCCVPLAQYEVATKCFEQVMTIETSSSATAAVTNVILERPTLVPIIYLGAESSGGSDAKMYLFYTGGPVKPFIFQGRESLKFQMKGADDIEFKWLKAMTEARYNIGFGHWSAAVLTTFT